MRRGCVVAAAALGLVGLVVAGGGCGQPADAGLSEPKRAALDVLRYSAAVQVFQTCRDSVVNIGCSRPDEKDPNTRHTEFGSGVVLHEAGFILTNAHILRHGGDVAVGFHGGGDYPARVVAADETADLALLKIEPDRRPVPIRLGRSRDLLVGEPVITMGNPLGMGLTVGQGIVSALGRATKSDFSFYPDMIQTDATTNPGSSGGPLLNVYGELVGINTTKNLKADNIAFAIPVDRVREVVPAMLEAEGRYGFTLGLVVESDRPARVLEVTGAPASDAGLRPGDLIQRVGGMDVARGLDFHLALVGRRGGEALPVRLLRNGRLLDVTVTLGKTESREADSVTGLATGLAWQQYDGQWEAMPDFATLKPAASGTAETFGLLTYAGRDGFALRLTGYIDVPRDGAYGFTTASDDGSRLWIGERLVVDNDGPHGPVAKRGFISLKAGKHPITVEYFDLGGEEALNVFWEGPDLVKQEIPASVLSHRPEAK